MGLSDALIGELEQEAATTRRVLERVPADKLSWKPHEKSMSLGQLALHVAQVPGTVASIAAQNLGSFPENLEQAAATSVDQSLSALDEGVSKAKEIVGGGARRRGNAGELCSLVAGAQTLLSMPRISLLRAIMLNH